MMTNAIARPVGSMPSLADAPSCSTPLLVAKDVEIVYQSKRGSVTALSGLTTSMAKGEFLSILGPSGCGKSTFLKLAAGLMKPTSGSIVLDGKPITGPRPDVGIVFQQATLMPWRTVLDNVLLPIRTLRRDIDAGRETAQQLLKMMGLEAFAKHYPYELSGGMQQRVGIARGLVHDPALLLMDEPFAALDAMTREHMMRELQSIWTNTRKSVVFITHSIPEAVFLSDRIVVLSARPGRMIKDVVVDLPRPRTLATMGERKFVDLCNELRALFDDLVKFD
ncbi:ABC transporter ATP-binding protein [soil metagenome]